MEKFNIIKNMSRIEILGRALDVCKKQLVQCEVASGSFFVVFVFGFVYIDVAHHVPKA